MTNDKVIPEAEKTKILLVDDEVDILLSLRGILRKSYRVITAETGEEALKIFEDSPEEFPVVISDQRMPGIQGHELLRAVHEKSPETIGFLLTGYTNFDDLINAVNEGHIYTYLSKPVDPEDLIMRLLAALELYNTRKKNLRLTEELQKINRTLESRIEQQTEQLKKQLRQIEGELEQARHTQFSLLPETLPNTKQFKTAARFVPMEQAGGDFYDVFELPGGQTGFIVADVTGHGIAAAMISFMLAFVFKNYVNMMAGSTENCPKKIMEQVNEMLFGQMPAGKFATIFYCVYEPQSRKLSYSSAGHPPACLVRANGQLEELHTEGLVLGMLPGEMADFEEQSVQLEIGDKVLLYTDAILEITPAQEQGPQGLAWEVFHGLLKEHHTLPISELLKEVEQGILKVAQQPKYDDDLTLLGFEIL